MANETVSDMVPAIGSLRAAYRRGAAVSDCVSGAYDRIAAHRDNPIWITLVPRDAVLEQAKALERQSASERARPLWGIPFAVKDNIDVAGMPTTAGCPQYAFVAGENAPVVQRLLDAGAILILSLIHI